MEAQIMKITPLIAKELLLQNKNNRKIKEKRIDFYVDQMKKGLWKENGEGFIIDCNGCVKNGQHRLLAVIKANFSYKAPVITGVNPDVMDTIDTGSNRSFADVLTLNGFQNVNTVSAIVFKIHKWGITRNALQIGGKSGKGQLSNSAALEYTYANIKMIEKLIKSLRPYYIKSNKSFSFSDIMFIQYLISNNGTKITETTIEYCKMLMGIIVVEGNSGSYIHSIKSKAKNSKTTLNPEWLLAIVIKGWNNFVCGDPKVNFLKWESRFSFPKVIKI